MDAMVHDLSRENSLIGTWVAELRDVRVQGDRLRFRRNLERIGEVAAYEISKGLPFVSRPVETPLGTATGTYLAEQPVLATILRAGLALHQGLLSYFDQGDSAFVSAYRKHGPEGDFEICLSYVSCPEIAGRILIISDPMLATGASLVKTIAQLRLVGAPKKIHLVTAIAARPGIEYVREHEPEAEIWCGCVDPALSPEGYIIPGLGDAGDLAYGPKMQR